MCRSIAFIFTLYQVRLAGKRITLSRCPLVAKLVNTILKTNNMILIPTGTSGPRGMAWRNNQLWGSGGQKSRSRGKRQIWRSTEAPYITPLGRAALLVVCYLHHKVEQHTTVYFIWPIGAIWILITHPTFRNTNIRSIAFELVWLALSRFTYVTSINVSFNTAFYN